MRRTTLRLNVFSCLLFIVVACLAAAAPALAQTRQANQPKKTRAERALARRIGEILSRNGARNAYWGIEVYSAESGRTVYSHNGDKYFTPASVTKLFTTAAALDLIGPNYKFRTTVETSGTIDEKGRLVGNIILVGRGDTDLAGCALPYVAPPPEPEEPQEVEEDEEEVCPFSQNLDRLAAQVSARGVTLVTGDLIADTTFLSREPYADGWAYHDVVWSYGAPVRALSIADNIIAYKVEPGAKAGAKANITWQPPTSLYSLRNSTWTVPAGTRTQLYLRRAPGTYEVEISGPIAFGRRPRTLALAAEEPAEVAAELFRESLLKAGVRVQGAIQILYGHLPSSPAPPSEEDPAQILAEHLSLPLAEDVRFILKVSQNMHTEVLLRLLGRSDPPETAEPVVMPRRSRNAPPPRIADGSTEAGLNVLRSWLHNAGIDPFDVALRDGSGLSLKGMVKPKAVTALLQYAATRPWADHYFDSFPIAGEDGTLRRRLRGASTAGRVHAKTGTLTGNIALGGFVDTVAGERLYFAVFLNHHVLANGRATGLIDDIMVALGEFPRGKK